MLLRALFAHQCSVVALFALHLSYLLGTMMYTVQCCLLHKCLLNRCTVCSTGLLFAPQLYCLLHRCTVCSTGVLFAQHFYCLLRSCSVCPSCDKYHKHVWLCFLIGLNASLNRDKLKTTLVLMAYTRPLC